MMAWQPQDEPLRQLAQCLRDSLSGHDISAMKAAELVRRPSRRRRVALTLLEL